MPSKMKLNIEPWEKPLIIVAAARSGTKMLREVLATSSEVIDFPYDMNYVWKYKNYHVPHDELTKNQITAESRAFIRNHFRKKYSKHKKAKIIIEKSVSNSLRVDFVKNIFPEGKIIHLYRDGRDVTADAFLCWQESAFSPRIQSRRDLLLKLKEFPYALALPYLKNYISFYLNRALSKSKQLKSWGPRFEGIDDAINTSPLLMVCAMQWAKSIEKALQDLSNYKENIDYINVRYEDLVTEPATQLRKILNFAGINSDSILKFADTHITPKYVGFWKTIMQPEELKKIEAIITPSMLALGYSMPKPT